MKEGEGRFFDVLARASTIGLHLVSGMIVGGGLGYAVDHFCGVSPWGIVGGVVVGIAAGVRNIWIDTKVIISSSDRQPAVSSGLTDDKDRIQRKTV